MPTMHDTVRTAALAFCGVLWAWIGLGVVLGEGGGDLLHEVLVPTPVRVVTWWAGAAVAAWSLMTWRATLWAAVVLVVAPMMRAASWFWAWIEGVPGAWYILPYHLALIGLVVVIALQATHERAIIAALHDDGED